MARRSRYFRGGQRRAIRKKTVYIEEGSNAGVQVSQTLDTSSERETLVRIVGNIAGSRTQGSAVNGYLYMWIQLIPSGTPLSNLTDPASSIVTLEGREANNILWHYANWLAGQYTTFEVDIDVKGMRKLEKDDTLRLCNICEVSGTNFGIFLTMFFKKT